MFQFFAVLAATLPARILAAMGIGFISMAGYGVAVNSLVSIAKTNWSGIGGVALQIASLMGAPVGFGIILGAVVMRASLTALTSLGKLTS